MNKKAVWLLMGAVLLAMVVLAGLLLAVPTLVDAYSKVRIMYQSAWNALVWGFYSCSLPAGCALLCLWRLLRNIGREQVFISENCRLLALLSWCCVLVAAITLVAGIWYMPLFFVTASMLFLFLIVRVVRSCFIAATALREENDLTI